MRRVPAAEMNGASSGLRVYKSAYRQAENGALRDAAIFSGIGLTA
jgi:hypothetical protein